MTQPTTPRDPHPDNALIDAIISEPDAQSGSSGTRMSEQIASRDEERSAFGGDPEPTRVTGQDKVQSPTNTRADFDGSQDKSDKFG